MVRAEWTLARELGIPITVHVAMGRLAGRFAMVKPFLDDTLHFHELDRGDFPYQLQSDLLIDAGWDGWWLLEASSKPPDRVQAMIHQRGMWEAIVAKSLNRS